MFKYKDIAFRVIEENDLDLLRRLHNSQSTWENLFNINFVDASSQLAWWKSLYKNSTDRRYIVCNSDNCDEVIGRLRIQNINLQHNNCEVGLDILPKYRGKGYGFKSYKMLLDYLFNHYNMNMVYLKVADFNPNAKKLYEKVGFVNTGFFPKYFYRHGKYWNYIIMSLTKQEFDKANEV